MNQQNKSFRQIFILLWSVSKSYGTYEEIQWARKEVTQFIFKKLTLGFYP